MLQAVVRNPLALTCCCLGLANACMGIALILFG